MVLITPSEMAAIQAIGLSGMQSTAIILTRAIVQTDDGQENVWATSSLDIPCWVREVTSPGRDLGSIAGAVNLVEEFLIRVPVGTEVRSGDRIVVGETTYDVQHSNNEDTYPDWLQCSCRAAAA